MNKKVIPSSYTYYINEEDEKFFEVYVHTKGLGGKRHRIFSYRDDNSVLPKLHYRTTNELLASFDFLGAQKANEIVVTNSNELLNKFDFNIMPVKDVLSSPQVASAGAQLVGSQNAMATIRLQSNLVAYLLLRAIRSNNMILIILE